VNIQIKADEQNSPPKSKTDLPAISSAAYKRKRLYMTAAVTAQIAIMCGTAIPAAMTLNSGSLVTLKTIPIDPYDMFRGDYVRLRYDISDLKTTPLPPTGSDIYVALHKNGEYWQARTSGITKPELLPGEVCIKGRFTYGSAAVHYGIEQVFVPEKTGRSAERAKNLKVEVAVNSDGKAVIKRVFCGDRAIYDATRVVWGGPG